MNKDKKQYICSVYVRYSGEDGKDATNATTSINNQIESIKVFCKNNNFLIFKVYIDYFKTGTNLNRSGLKDLFLDMKLGLFNTIIVKDLSRFSRNYLDAGVYLEEVFPSLGIRFISINDNYDSLYQPDDETIPLKNYLNTMYSKDLKKKIHQSFILRSKTKDIINIHKYGYKKDSDGKLIVDDESANVIRRIFKEAIAGKKPTEIAKGLISDNIYYPSYYKLVCLKININQNHQEVLKNPYNWGGPTVSLILKDYEYCGHGINLTNINCKLKKHNQILKNIRPAIIDEETFKLAPKKFKKSNNSRKDKSINPILRCPYCKRAYSYSDNKKYYCPKCLFRVESNFIHEVIYLDCINLINEVTINSSKAINNIIQSLYQNNDSDNEKKIMNLKRKFKELFEKKVMGSINDSDFETIINEYNKELEKLKEERIVNNQIPIEKLKLNFERFIKEKIDINNISKLDLIKKMVSDCFIIKKNNENFELKIIYKFCKE